MALVGGAGERGCVYSWSQPCASDNNNDNYDSDDSNDDDNINNNNNNSSNSDNNHNNNRDINTHTNIDDDRGMKMILHDDNDRVMDVTEVILRHLAGRGVQVSGEVVACHQGDDHVVNCLEQHPHLPHVLATSGDGF